jgi:uridine phosphorylase
LQTARRWLGYRWRNTIIASRFRPAMSDASGSPHKLYGDYGREDWCRVLAIAADEIPDVLIVHGEWEPQPVLDRWAARLDTCRTAAWNLLLGTHDGLRLGFTVAHGGPSAAVSVHPFAVMGVPLVIQTGYYGGLVETLEYGEILVVDAAEPEDRVASGYVGEQPSIAADRRLVDEAMTACAARSRPARRGSVVTIANSMIETHDMVLRWAACGHVGVEMEAATTFAIARAFGLRAVALLNLVDNLARGHGFYDDDAARDELGAATMESIFEVALELAHARGSR